MQIVDIHMNIPNKAAQSTECKLDVIPVVDAADCYQAQPAACHSNLGYLSQAFMQVGLVTNTEAQQAMDLWQEVGELHTVSFSYSLYRGCQGRPTPNL